MSNPVKLQINSLEALERLIGGDSQLEVELRNSVVQEFTNRHLKGVANQINTSQIIKNIEESIKQYITAHFGTLDKDIYGRYINSVTLNGVVKEAITKHIQEVFPVIIKDAVQNAVKSFLEKNNIEGLIRVQFSMLTKEFIKKAVTDKFQEITKELNNE